MVTGSNPVRRANYINLLVVELAGFVLCVVTFMTPYSGCKIYGPYLRPDGRKHIVAIFPDKSRKTVSYPKYLMELSLQRYLDIDETVDHIDRDKTNDSISNLRVISKSKHSSVDAKRLLPQNLTCPVCENEFTLEGQQLHDAYANRDRGKTGPYCSKSCASKCYSLGINFNTLPEIREYYFLNK